MEQLDSQLPAAEVTLDPAVLDRIDELVAPAVTINPADNSYGDHVLQPAQRRARRPVPGIIIDLSGPGTARRPGV